MNLDLREQLRDRERTAPVGTIDVAAITTRTSRGRRLRTTSQVTGAVTVCVAALLVGRVTFAPDATAPPPPAATGPAPTAEPSPAVEPVAVAPPACGDAVPPVVSGTPVLVATVVPDFTSPSAGQVATTLVLQNRAPVGDLPGELSVTSYLAQDGRIVAATPGEPRSVGIREGGQDVTAASVPAVGCDGSALPDGQYDVFASVRLTPLGGGADLSLFTGGLPVTIEGGTPLPRPEIAGGGTISASSGDVLDGTVTIVWEGPSRPGDVLTLEMYAVALDPGTTKPLGVTQTTAATLTAPDDRVVVLRSPLAARELHDLTTGEPMTAGEMTVQVVVEGYVVSADGSQTTVVALPLAPATVTLP